MTCIAAEFERSAASPSKRPGKWDVIRASVFWGFILLVIVSPAAMSALILLRS